MKGNWVLIPALCLANWNWHPDTSFLGPQFTPRRGGHSDLSRCSSLVPWLRILVSLTSFSPTDRANSQIRAHRPEVANNKLRLVLVLLFPMRHGIRGYLGVLSTYKKWESWVRTEREVERRQNQSAPTAPCPGWPVGKTLLSKSRNVSGNSEDEWLHAKKSRGGLMLIPRFSHKIWGWHVPHPGRAFGFLPIVARPLTLFPHYLTKSPPLLQHLIVLNITAVTSIFMHN